MRQLLLFRNQDGLDDLIVCERKGPPHIYIQRRDGGFHELNLPNSKNIGWWRSVRFFRLGSEPHLVVVEGVSDEPASVRVFQGINRAPWFAFDQPLLTRKLKYAAPDVEIVDANGVRIIVRFWARRMMI